ncbi:mitogen-activated protein kinase kinase kinase 18-like [Camellia sinensis]|uniref:mitogen-activated protein kinase kinase kinase 18-like n=1 Tax=Camellia sinensis TaxID=4442 RepID=UPI0010367404|nr:mitogen-activated protein kinase kinase kinase 18-like [Camellia sinensis]
MAPESIRYEDYKPEADIWALGCKILELLTGKESWKCDRSTERVTILFKIASTQEIPEIQSGFSKDAEDFLNKYLVRDPKSRWTANMLLGHPFASVGDGVLLRVSWTKETELFIQKQYKGTTGNNLDVDDDVDLLPTFCPHIEKTYLSATWATGFTYIGQHFKGGASDFRKVL